MICWLSGRRPQYSSCTASITVQQQAWNQSSGFRGWGGKKTFGGTLTQPRLDAFGMPQQSGKYFAPNPMLSSFGMDFAHKFVGEDQKNQKRSSPQNLKLLDHVRSICFAVS